MKKILADTPIRKFLLLLPSLIQEREELSATESSCSLLKKQRNRLNCLQGLNRV